MIYEENINASVFKKHKTIVEIDLTAISSNIDKFRAYLKPDTKLLAMVKSSSYGCGGVKIAKFLETKGIDYLGVAYVDEGVDLRKNDIKAPILVMNTDKELFLDCIKYNLEPSVHSFEQLEYLIQEIKLKKIKTYSIHLKIDTGMHRLGFLPNEIEEVVKILNSSKSIKIKSIYSHLSDTDNQDKTYTNIQIQSFDNIVKYIEKELNSKFIKHLLNSSGIINHSNAQYDMVRLGIGLYGYSSDIEMKSILKPSIKWKSFISQIKDIPEGEHIGYNCTYKSTKPIKIAIISIGYADGFRRNLGQGKGNVSIRGIKCPVIGRVCMDMIMIDVTEIPEIEIGENVEIIGDTITMYEFSSLLETIPYEIMTNISERVKRVYIE